jgi:hypothetical protein
MAMLVVATSVAVVLLLALIVLRRRPPRSLESLELSAYHDGLDALTRLEAERAHPE